MSEIHLMDKRRSILTTALDELQAQDNGDNVLIREVPFEAWLHVRGLEPVTELNSALNSVLGVELPSTPNTTVASGDIRIFWHRERMWIVTCPPAKHFDVFEQIEHALKNLDSSVVDVSDNFTILRLSGEKARDTLRKGCTLDLHPREFPVGSMAWTNIAHADVCLHYYEDTDAGHPDYALHVRTSFAEYLLRWLHDAGREFGVKIIE